MRIISERMEVASCMQPATPLQTRCLSFCFFWICPKFVDNFAYGAQFCYTLPSSTSGLKCFVPWVCEPENWHSARFANCKAVDVAKNPLRPLDKKLHSAAAHRHKSHLMSPLHSALVSFVPPYEPCQKKNDPQFTT